MQAESTDYIMFKIFWRRLFLGWDYCRLLYIPRCHRIQLALLSRQVNLYTLIMVA